MDADGRIASRGALMRFRAFNGLISWPRRRPSTRLLLAVSHQKRPRLFHRAQRLLSWDSSRNPFRETFERQVALRRVRKNAPTFKVPRSQLD